MMRIRPGVGDPLCPMYQGFEPAQVRVVKIPTSDPNARRWLTHYRVYGVGPNKLDVEPNWRGVTV